MDLIWGLLITGVGVIIGLAVLIVGGCFISIWIGDLWGLLPYRVREVIEKIGMVVKVIFITLVVLTGLFIMTLIAYDGICG
jgi:hypothetical protein